MSKVTRLVPARSAEVLSDCRRLAAEHLPISVKSVLDKADDALFDLANKADNSFRQNLYFDAMRELRLKRATLEDDFIGHFNSEFENSLDLAKAKDDPALQDPGFELALVESDEVEETLAVTNFVQSVSSQCKEELFGLDKRMGFLLSDPDLENSRNPVGPEVIGNAFRAACRKLDADVEIKLTLFKLLDKFAGHAIHQFYRSLNEHLVDHDVLPKIVSRAPRAAGSPRTRVIIETDGDRVEASGPDVFSTLQDLMLSQPQQPGIGAANATGGYPGVGIPGAAGAPASAGQGGAPQGVGGPSASGAVTALGTVAIVNTLTQLQQGNLSGLSPATVAAVSAEQIQAGNVNVIRGLRETGAIGALNQTDGLTLDIVSILFDYILDDPAIPDAMKALIGRLQIPVLKVALIDKELFSKRTHPARRLLDRLAEAAVGCSDSLLKQDGLFGFVEKLIKQVIDQFDDDIEVFRVAVAELDSYLEAEDELTARRTEESAKSLNRREQIVLAKMAVDEAVNERIAGRDLREFVRQFIVDFWRQLLIITHVEVGIDSDEWRNQLGTIDNLIESLDHKETAAERKELTTKLPQLLRELKRGMITLELEPETCSKFLSMLASVHVVSVKHLAETSLAEKHLREDEPADEPLAPPADTDEAFIKQGLARLFDRQGVSVEELDIDLSTLEEEPEEDTGIAATDLAEYVEMVTSLDLGDWMEFDHFDGTTLRARFTWISPDTGRYLFTTRQGQKALDTTLLGLAEQLSQGVARIIRAQPDPLFDRAIGDLMVKLENTATG